MEPTHEEVGVAFLEVHMVQIEEVIRRWQAGESKVAIGRASGVSARTVGRYIEAAVALGVEQDGTQPSEQTIAALVRRNHPGPLPKVQPAMADELAKHKKRIRKWLKKEKLQLTRIHELLQREGVGVSYTSLRRYVLDTGLKEPKTTVRMPDWPPGEVAEMDFGKLGTLVDESTQKRLTVWALIIILPFSRHSFVWPLVQQTLEETIAGLDAAWGFFGGIPKRLILDYVARHIIEVTCPSELCGRSHRPEAALRHRRLQPAT